MYHHITSLLHTLLVGLLLLMGATSCGRSSGDQSATLELDLRLESSATLPGQVWYLYTHGATSVTIDSIAARGATARYERSYDRDTVDFFVLYGSDGSMVLPLLPDTLGVIRAHLGGRKEQLSGMQGASLLMAWRGLLRGEAVQRHGDGDEGSRSGATLPLELYHFLDSVSSNRLSYFLVQEAYRRYPQDPCVEDLYVQVSRSSMGVYDLQRAMGVDPVTYAVSDGFSYMLPQRVQEGRAGRGGKRERPLTLGSVSGKAPYLVLLLLPPTYLSDSAQLSHLYSRLDSLSVPSLTLTLMADTVPSYWHREENEKRPRRLFCTDSIGEASQYAMRITELNALPTYLMVDSTGRVWRQWHETSEVAEYLEQMRSAQEQTEPVRNEQ